MATPHSGSEHPWQSLLLSVFQAVVAIVFVIQKTEFCLPFPNTVTQTKLVIQSVFVCICVYVTCKFMHLPMYVENCVWGGERERVYMYKYGGHRPFILLHLIYLVRVPHLNPELTKD